MGDPSAARRMLDLINLGGKGLRIALTGQIALQSRQECVHPLKFERRAKEAGEELPGGDELGDGTVCKGAAVQIFAQRVLMAQGGGLGKVSGEVHAVVAERCLKLMHQVRLTLAGQIHLVDKKDRRDLIARQQPPQGAGVALDAVGAADHQQRAVHDLQGPLHLGREVHVARGVQQGDPAVAQGNLACLEKMVMPRSRSKALESRKLS